MQYNLKWIIADQPRKECWLSDYLFRLPSRERRLIVERGLE